MKEQKRTRRKRQKTDNQTAHRTSKRHRIKTEKRPSRKTPRRRRSSHASEQVKVPRLVRIGLIVLFVVMFGILMQQAVIIGLDRDVSRLQAQVKAQQSLNDSKEGKIISGRNLDKIEEKARSYGMTEPTKKQYQTVVVTPKSEDTSPFATFKARIRAFVNQIKRDQAQSGGNHAKTAKTKSSKSGK